VEHASLERWQEAQKAELDWWQNWRRLPFYANHSFASYWNNIVSELIGPAGIAKAQTIVEVGCGPHGVVRYLFKDARLKIGTDPLLYKYDERPRPDATTLYAAAIGEALPVGDGVADLVICINVIDHVMDAGEILREMRRVLKPGGLLLLEVHTFPAIFTPIMFFDHPHTYHWTKKTVFELVRKTGFAVKKTRQFGFPINVPWTSVFNPAHWKYIFGKLFMRLTYVSAERP
jgi:ubiquinone/menaquinone biosynthesis C-methylase UbiE